MKRLHLLFSLVTIFSGLLFGAVFVHAEDVPTSKCVTATTQATRDKALVQMEKDIAPYLKDKKAESVVAEYKQNLQTAWEAMEQPYCGYGAYGTASAIKSFTKSITRARASFLEKIKDPAKAKVSLMKQEAVQLSLSDESLKKETSASSSAAKRPVSKTLSATIAKEPISNNSDAVHSGLHRGMRSDDVKKLQRKLAKHFDIAESDLVTGYFGSRTQSLVVKFQLEKKLISGSSSNAAGVIGPKTIRALNAL